MTSHQRILAVLNRQPVDRPPVDIWLTAEVLESLKRHIGETHELAAFQCLGVDKIVRIVLEYDLERSDPDNGTGRNLWGVPTQKVKAGKATYEEYGVGPLADYDSPEELDRYQAWPDPDRFNYEAAKEHAKRARRFNFATIGPWVSHFEIYCNLRGMENALMDVIAEPDFLDATLDRIEAIQSTMLDRFLTELGDLIDVVFISDDLGTQTGQLISIDAWKRFLRPRLCRWVDLIHGHGKKVLFHTDGSSRAFVPYLIECGIDILNPIQHICPGMERAALKRDFGDRLIFHGGVENQHVLPFGTPEEVRLEVETCLKTLGQGGGFITSSCHNIQAGTPVENILAMIDSVHRWKGV